MKSQIAQYMNASLPVDYEGSPVCGVRLNPTNFYHAIPKYLQQYINEKDLSAWHKITSEIDEIYYKLDDALISLNQETNFMKTIKSEAATGKKLFFKLNLVLPLNIDPITHGAGSQLILTTEWPFLAATMRWFHDRLGIHYYQMATGDAPTTTFLLAATLTSDPQHPLTPEVLVEGKSGNFYGGWGFFFVRKYLEDRHPTSHTDSPMNGYEESVSGTFLPPGKAGNRLMLYDLNKVEDTPPRGRTVPVPKGENFSEVTLHKVIIGGDPKDPEDMKNYPGCILINLPKPKLHEEELLTNAIKNLGIGLYPSQCPQTHTMMHEHNWKYACPSEENPNLKSKLPHSN